MRTRSISSFANTGSRATSATSASAASSLGVVTVIETSAWFQPAPLSSEPPSASAAAASCGALWRLVPCVISDALSDASPASRGGSASAPASATSSALTSGTPSRRATITRRPLSSFISLGAAIVSGRGAAGGGGVVYGCAIARAPASASAERERSAARAVRGGGQARSFLRRRFLAIVDRHLVRAEHVAAHARAARRRR